MNFVHEDPEFSDLLQIVSEERKFSRGVIEKDYWVTHSLWSLNEAGFEVWFKGGTSLSKGFNLIERFSEDLDLKIEPGMVGALPKVSNWKSDGTKAVSERRTYFEKLSELISVPGARIALAPDSVDRAWRSADILVLYPGLHLAELDKAMSPFVRLEVGNARVIPFIPRNLTSFVHEKLAEQNQLDNFIDNRPQGVRCVHPLVTLLEKIDALHRRFPNESAEPATFIRHYEDAARIIATSGRLPPLKGYADLQSLATEMLAQKQIAVLPADSLPALAPDEGPRWNSLRRAHAAIDTMFWGPRVSLDDACATIRTWAKTAFNSCFGDIPGK
ncbi:MAG: nucleotidyl transferase AbiEii/AbiGii toxin family protein [Fibrobacteria bacterium]